MAAAVAYIPYVIYGLAAAGAVAGGVMQAQAANTQAKFAEYQAQQQVLAAKQIQAQNRDELAETLSTVEAMRASRGLDNGSPTARAQRRSNKRVAHRNENADVLGALTGAAVSRQQAGQSRVAARMAMIQGAVGATTSLGNMAT